MTETRTLVLGIDTSGARADIAVVRDGVCVGSFHSPAGKKARGESLAGPLESLLRDLDAGANDLRGIGIVNGPGSYTGLRVGLALARGLAFQANLPVVGLGTLEVLALQARQGQPEQVLVPLLDAGSQAVYAAAYGGDHDSPLLEPQSLDPAELPTILSDLPAVGAAVGAAEQGSALVVVDDPALAERMKSWFSAPHEVPRHIVLAAEKAEFAAQIAEHRLSLGQGAAAETVLPCYLGGSSARPNRNKVMLTSEAPR